LFSLQRDFPKASQPEFLEFRDRRRNYEFHPQKLESKIRIPNQACKGGLNIEHCNEILYISDDAAEMEESTGKPPKPLMSGNLTKL
jgi:hypothetical protein